MEKELLNLILFEIREVKGDVSELKSDMKEVKTRLTNVENRMTNIEDRMTNMEDRMTNIEDRMANFEGRMTNVEDLGQFNKETAESIKNVVTSHYMEFKKYIKSNNTQHNVYNAKLLEYRKEK